MCRPSVYVDLCTPCIPQERAGERVRMMNPQLYKAAKEGDVTVLPKIYPRSGKMETHAGNNILHIAARAGQDTFVAEALWRFPFLYDKVNSQEETPLVVAARFGHLKVVEVLANSPIQDDMAAAVEIIGTNLRSSSSSRPWDVEEGLIGHQLEQDITQDGMATALDNGTNSGSSCQPDVEEQGPVHLQLDMLIPSHWRVTTLEQDTTVTVTTALHEALRNGHEDVARYLLGLKPEQAAFYNLAGESPLFLAAESRCELFMTDILLSNQPYSTKGPDGLNALHVARDSCGEIISLLIKQNRHLMRQLDNRGKAAIHHAVEAEYWLLLRQILTADPSIALLADAHGCTPLLTASIRGCWKICEDILKICPESIDARDHKGQNALHLCGSMSNGSSFVKIPEIWELLNVGDKEGNTPLHTAIEANDYDKAMLLISSVSIDLGAVNKEGRTALDLCESDWRHLNKKRLMWFHLRRYGAPRGRAPNEHMVPVGGTKMVVCSPDEDMKPYINTMSVVAALLATLTFAAAFTMPGGYDSSGEATLAKKAALWVFILSDALAMCCSITVVSLLWKAMVVEQDLQFVVINASVTLLHIALLATLVAFVSGLFAVIAAKALWVVILLCIVCPMVFCLLTPGRVQRSSLSTWFMPNTITRDILRFIRMKQRSNKRKRDQRHALSLIKA